MAAQARVHRRAEAPGGGSGAASHREHGQRGTRDRFGPRESRTDRAPPGRRERFRGGRLRRGARVRFRRVDQALSLVIVYRLTPMLPHGPDCFAGTDLSPRTGWRKSRFRDGRFYASRRRDDCGTVAHAQDSFAGCSGRYGWILSHASQGLRRIARGGFVRPTRRGGRVVEGARLESV